MAQKTPHKNVQSPPEKIMMQAPEGTSMEPEFSHILTLAELKLNQDPIALEANAKQCAALAARFDLPAIYSLKADISLSNDPIQMRGVMQAKIDQICVATGETISCAIKEDIAINFLETPDVNPNDSEIELEDDDCDTIFYNGREIDIGEAIAQSLYLAIDPFPRIENSDIILAKVGVISEEEMAAKLAQEKQENNPFAALSQLKK